MLAQRSLLLLVSALVVGACDSERVMVSGDAAPAPDAALDAIAPLDQGAPPDQDLPPDQNLEPDPQPSPGRCEVCTDPVECCMPESLICIGRPDRNVVCTCPALWDCDLNANLCTQPLPGALGECKLSGSTVTCSLPGALDTPPIDPSNSAWSCSHDPASQRWRCVRERVNPCGVAVYANQWSCEIELTAGGGERLQCERL